MSKLTTGGNTIPNGWSYPSPVWIKHKGIRGWFGGGKFVSGGIVWSMNEAATDADIMALTKSLGSNVQIDRDSLVGRADPKYTTFAIRHGVTQQVRIG